MCSEASVSLWFTDSSRIVAKSSNGVSKWSYEKVATFQKLWQDFWRPFTKNRSFVESTRNKKINEPSKILICSSCFSWIPSCFSLPLESRHVLSRINCRIISSIINWAPDPTFPIQLKCESNERKTHAKTRTPYKQGKRFRLRAHSCNWKQCPLSAYEG